MHYLLIKDMYEGNTFRVMAQNLINLINGKEYPGIGPRRPGLNLSNGLGIGI